MRATNSEIVESISEKMSAVMSNAPNDDAITLLGHAITLVQCSAVQCSVVQRRRTELVHALGVVVRPNVAIPNLH